MGFVAGFCKSASIVGSSIGALMGGEPDEEGGKKNRHIGALRGAGTSWGATLGSALTLGTLLLNRKKSRGRLTKAHFKKLMKKAPVRGLLGAGLGGAGGYVLTKHLGPKYEHEKQT